jgi:hypothetical protein
MTVVPMIATSRVVTQTEIITPEIARRYLAANHCNRNLSRPHVIRLVNAMLSGEFHHTHQGIAFDEFGNLIDGQHRLSAIVESGTSQPMQVTRGISSRSRSMVDGQIRPRRISDSLMMEGHDLSHKDMVAMARMWLELEGNRSPAIHEIRNFLDLHRDAFLFVSDLVAGNQILKHASISAMIGIAYEVGYEEEMKNWCEILKSGMVTEQWQSSAIKFRDYWLSIKHGGGSAARLEFCKRVYTSMSAFVEKRGLSKLYAKETITWLKKI